MDYYIKEFLNNPSGKGSTVLNINIIKKAYINKYDSICKKIKHKTYFVDDKIYIIVNIPSSVDGIFYDVLLKFEKTKKSIGDNILDMRMQLFSNSPSFLYTFANAYDKQKLFIRECRRKLSSKMLSDIAKTKNPYGLLSYDYTIFSALFYIVNNNYTSVTDLRMDDHVTCNIGTVLRDIKDADALQKTRKLQKIHNKNLEEKIKRSKNIAIRNSGRITDKKEDKIENTRETKQIKSLSRIKSNKKNKKVKGI